jgi:Tfp pilus assembly protein PilP
MKIVLRSKRRQSRCGLDRFLPSPAALILILGLFSALLVPMNYAQEAKKRPVADAHPFKVEETASRYSGVSFNPGNRRDPFLNPLQSKKDATKHVEEDEEVSRGAPPPGMGGTLITQATLQGISVNGNGKMAVLRGADSRAYFVKEGDRLFDGYLKTIDDDSITLVRVTRMKSGKVLTQDAIKRLRTP